MVVGGLNVGSALAARVGGTSSGSSAVASAPSGVSQPSAVAPVAPHVPSSTATTWKAPASNVARALDALPAAERQTPWIRALTQPSSSLKPLTSLPNLNLLEHPATSVAGSITPGYVAQPAPLGIGDFGLGSSPYAYNASHFLGQVTFLTPPNVTDPASTGVIEPAIQGQRLGYVGSTNEFGIQLNTVATNITFPGSDQGFFWTQNVVNWNDSGIHFVSDTFNTSAGSHFYIPPGLTPTTAGTIVSGCGVGTANVNEILEVYGGVFQCVGGTVPVSAASYPVTIQLFNNATVNALGQDVVNFSYYIDEAGIGAAYTGVYNSVVFNNPASPVAPPNLPGFSVSGFAPTPVGLLRDSEIDLVGDIGGDNSVFRAMNATVNLEYTNLSVGGWKNVPSAYNFGGDTGETSTGIADYWTPAHTLVMHQGPAMLYGLWNAVPRVSVASGYIQLAGKITPNYGFVFVSNTAPVNDPLAAGAGPDNLSWLPTAANGTFNTYLPPLGAPWTTQYYVQGFAAGSQEVNGTAVTGTTTGYSLVLPLAKLTSVPRAPLYMFSAKQASDLYYNISLPLSSRYTLTGPPYWFGPMLINTNISFNHLNDYDYPSFELFMSQGVSHVVTDGLYQGTDTPCLTGGTDCGNYYIWDGAASRGLIFPAPVILGPAPDYTSQINIYFGSYEDVLNQTLYGEGTQGGEVVLWEDTDAYVAAINTTAGQGVFVGDSQSTLVRDLFDSYGYGVQDVGSVNTSATSIGVFDGLGVVAYSSSYGSYTWINVTYGDGFASGADFGLGSGYYATFYDLPGTFGATVANVTDWSGFAAVNVTLSPSSVVRGISCYYGGWAVREDTSPNSVFVSITSVGCLMTYVGYTDPVVIVGLISIDTYYGVFLVNNTGSQITESVFYNDLSYGVVILGGTNNVVWDNSFILNDGSTNVYNPATIQAYSTPGNFFNSPGKVGNYWSDWHSAAPYVVGPGVADLYPLAAGGPGTYPVTFTESGLPTTDTWIVGLSPSGNLTAKGAQTTIVIYLPNSAALYPIGWYDFAFSTNDSTYVPSYSGGIFFVAGAGYSAPTVTFTPVSVTFTESGILAKTLAKDGWTVVLDGKKKHSTSASISFGIGEGTYPVLVTGPSGYTSNAHGSVTISTPTKAVAVTFTKGKTVKLTFAQKGIPTGKSLCVSVNGFDVCTLGKSVVFANLTAGLYNYSVVAPDHNATLALGKASEPLSGALTVTKSEKLTLTYLYTYLVVFTETGFTGSWSVKIGKVTETNATGGSITFTLANGTYKYKVGKETGFTSAGTPPSPITVSGKAVAVKVKFTAKP